MIEVTRGGRPVKQAAPLVALAAALAVGALTTPNFLPNSCQSAAGLWLPAQACPQVTQATTKNHAGRTRKRSGMSPR